MSAKRATQPRVKVATAPSKDGDDPQLRTRLVEAALQLFTLYGYQSVTVSDIGAAANVTGPALYRYFSNKEALLSAALYLSADRTVDDANQILVEAPTPKAALERLVRNWARAAVSDKSRLVIGYFQESQHLSATDRKKLDQKYLTYVSLISKVLESVVPQLSEQERNIRVQAAMGMIASAPNFLSDVHETSLIETLTDLTIKILT